MLARAVRLGVLVLAAVALAPPSPGAQTQAPAAGAASGATRYLGSLAAEPSGAAAAPAIEPAAQAAVKAVTERFGVKVLSARRSDENGRAVYEIVVMRPGGDFDDAYAVDTLSVDAKTGELVPQFRSETSGYTLSAPPDRTPRDSAVSTTIRRQSFRRTEPGL